MKNIVITGASEGIGRALALEFLRNSDTRLFLISRNIEKLNSISNDNSADIDRISIYSFDLVNGDYNLLIERIKEKFDKVDILINNAGVIVNKTFAEINPSEFDQVIATNLKAPFFLIQHLMPLYVSGTHIINISSMGGFQGSVKFPGLSLYSASKGALAVLTESLSAEFSNSGISVNCLALGSVQTAMFEEAFPGFMSPTSAASIAEYIAWFSLNAHKWINGKIIPVSISTP
jgi:NAD(P)-dependent dehydrogenase (short-subunit alcohol dehydrogenase family)